MQYTRPMIELVYEIRRRVPADLKPGIKLANPEIAQELAVFYRSSKDVIIKTLIKELFQLAGDDWSAFLEDTAADKPKQIAKVYRGQVTLEDAPSSKATEESGKRTRIYRGQKIIED